MTGQKYVAGKGNPSPIEGSVNSEAPNQASSATNQSVNSADEQLEPVVSGTLELSLICRFGRDSEAMIVYRALATYKAEQLDCVLKHGYTDEDEKNTALDEIEIAEQIMLDIVSALQQGASTNLAAYDLARTQSAIEAA